MVVENFSKGFQLASKVYYLAILPFIVDLFFQTGKAIDAISSNTIHYGVKFSFPDHFPSLTDFFAFPSPSGIQTNTPNFSSQPFLTLAYFLALAVVSSLVTAGYLGKMNAARLGESSSFITDASKYFLPILIYNLFVVALILVDFLFILALLSLLLGILFLLAFFVIYYFVFLTPFGIVVDNLRFSDALIRSKNLASTKASDTLGYVVLYAILTAIISVPVSAFMNGGLSGFLIAVAISAFAGTALVASTLHLYVQITQPPIASAVLTEPPSNPPSTQPPP